jgi:putative transposase
MARPLRAADGGYVYHALNRSSGRVTLFDKDADFEAFERVLQQAVERTRMRLLAYCVMPNHWHLVVWPRKDGDLSRFVGWLSFTHTLRWHAHRHSAGTGHVYQGRFKSFPVQEDDHFLTLCRYVERNALRAGLVRRAELWRWCSLWRRESGSAAERAILTAWPISRPRRWLEIVNKAQTSAEIEAVREAMQRGRPFGSEPWTKSAARRLNLESTMRPRGRPPKMPEEREKGS